MKTTQAFNAIKTTTNARETINTSSPVIQFKTIKTFRIIKTIKTIKGI